jgi:hypothetical protein
LPNLLTRQSNIASRHPRLLVPDVWVSGIGRRNTSKTKKDSGRACLSGRQAGMTELRHLIAESELFSAVLIEIL